MPSLIDKIKKNSTVKESAILADSKIFQDKDMISTSIPGINIILSGKIDGGLTPGCTIFSGQSRNFKTGLSLFLAKTYMDHYPDSVLLFYDSEFGSRTLLSSFGIDQSRVYHVPIVDVEALRFDLVNQLHNIEKGDKVIIMIDSISNCASRKEIDDALAEKTVADMTRAKQIKSLFRMITPSLTIKDIPLIGIAHTYKEMGSMYPKDILAGGQALYYSADNIYIISRRQDKDGNELMGYEFVISVEKSRYVKEKTKMPIMVSFETGISKWSGLLDIALESGHVIKPNQGWYSRVHLETGVIEDKKYRMKDTMCKDFWKPILESESFKNYVKATYSLEHNSMNVFQDEETFSIADEELPDEL